MLLTWRGCLSVAVWCILAEALFFGGIHDLAGAKYDQTLSATRTKSPTPRFDTISDLLDCLAASEPGRLRVRAYLEQRVGTVETYPFQLIETFPDLAIEFLRAGALVQLQNPRARGWDHDVKTLNSLVGIDPATAWQVLTDSLEELLEAVQSPQTNDMHDLPEFFDIVDDLDHAILDRLLNSVNVEVSRPVWTKRLEDTGQDARALVGRAAQLEGEVGDMARELLADLDGRRDPSSDRRI